MKRIVPALSLLLLVAVTILLGLLFVDNKTDHMLTIIKTAYTQCENEDYDKTKETLKDFDAVLKRDGTLLMLFIHRDLIDELRRITKPLCEYANEESKYDFFTEAKRAIEQLELIRESQYRLL